jgi:putative FmdB family regulatory protein
MNGTLLFAADDGAAGNELWALIPCGDGALNPGEQCDDGNTVGGDCCSAACTYEAAGTKCSDGNACTMSDTCDGTGACTSGSRITCNDGEACTLDSCDRTDGCRFLAVAFADAYDVYDAGLRMDACAEKKLPKAVTKRFQAAEQRVRRAEKTASVKKRKRLLAAAETQLRRTNGAVKRARKKLGEACVAVLDRRIALARSRTQCLRAALGGGRAGLPPAGTSGTVAAMPLYEYVCRDCTHAFEELVFGDATPACPKCGAAAPTRVLSVVSVGRSAGPAGAGRMPAPCGTCGDPRGPGACSS